MVVICVAHRFRTEHRLRLSSLNVENNKSRTQAARLCKPHQLVWETRDERLHGMKLLLDTHAFLWFVSGDTRLSRAARRALESDGNELILSARSNV